MLVQHGGNDKRLVDGWPAYEAALKAANVRHEGYIYPNAEHGLQQRQPRRLRRRRRQTGVGPAPSRTQQSIEGVARARWLQK